MSPAAPSSALAPPFSAPPSSGPPFTPPPVSGPPASYAPPATAGSSGPALSAPYDPPPSSGPPASYTSPATGGPFAPASSAPYDPSPSSGAPRSYAVAPSSGPPAPATSAPPTPFTPPTPPDAGSGPAPFQPPQPAPPPASYPAPPSHDPAHQGPTHQGPAHQGPAYQGPAHQAAPLYGPPPLAEPPTPTNGGHRGLQPPADPWASAAPLTQSPMSPWASPPTVQHQPPAAPPVHAPPGPTGLVPLPPPPPGAPPVAGPPAPAYPAPERSWTGEAATPTAEEFARRRAARPADPVARTGVRAAVNKTTLGLVKLAPGQQEIEFRQDIERVRRNFGGLRQVTVVNPKGGAGKTVAVLLLAMTFGQKRGGYVLAWDNNETQGTLGMRAQQDFHSRTVRDMLRDLGNFQGARGRVGDLSQYVRAQGEGMFDVLASDESATAGEMLTAHAFGEIREVVSRFYKLIVVDTGNNVRAQNWQAAIDATDQLVVTMSARNDSAETAARMLDHLEQTGRTRLVRQAVTVVSMPPRAKDIDLPPIQGHFAARTRAVLVAPYDRLIDTGEPIRYGELSPATLDAWLKVAATVSEGL
ncbi:chromosome partitioning protein [Actinomycetes bacterium KLBMP 9797]